MTNDAPGWEELLQEQMTTTGQEPGRRCLALNYPPQFAGPINLVAAQRNISLTALARRSLMAVVTYDLGLDWMTVMQDEPVMRGFNKDISDNERTNGLGHGPWRITGLDFYD